MLFHFVSYPPMVIKEHTPHFHKKVISIALCAKHGCRLTVLESQILVNYPKFQLFATGVFSTALRGLS